MPNTIESARGYDGPVVDREADYLNRWPMAREVYGIATTGSKDWSVRIGIYGEWGSGKSSVLKFISSMAEKDGQIVIQFNPWQHSAKDSLWRAFVLSIFADPRLAKLPGAVSAKAKGWFGGILKQASLAESGAAIFNEKAAKGVGAGLELVKSFVSFNRNDLKPFQDALGEKRVIVLIDDLDRTSGELVPEILFALKELMDIPGFSFICAFDPVVVGEILGEYHPGFGDGLKFLDKIIDYPRWLSPATTEGLTKLALADAKHSCPFVPVTVIQDAIPLLPLNPRSIRQFIRILALLKTQIERHHDSELSWSAIIASNILKVRYPRIAHELLSDAKFWDGIGMSQFRLRDENVEEKIGKSIDEQLQKTVELNGIKLEALQLKEIKAAMVTLASQMNLFSGLRGESVSYQFNIAEAPAAVTWKEFDGMLQNWGGNPKTEPLKIWIRNHAEKVQRSEKNVFQETLRAAIQRYGEALHQADNVLIEADRAAHIDKARILFTCLQALCFELVQPEFIGLEELEALIQKFASVANSSMPVHQQFWPDNEAFILEVFNQWTGDAELLIKVLENMRAESECGCTLVNSLPV